MPAHPGGATTTEGAHSGHPATRPARSEPAPGLRAADRTRWYLRAPAGNDAGQFRSRDLRRFGIPWPAVCWVVGSCERGISPRPRARRTAWRGDPGCLAMRSPAGRAVGGVYEGVVTVGRGLGARAGRLQPPAPQRCRRSPERGTGAPARSGDVAPAALVPARIQRLKMLLRHRPRKPNNHIRDPCIFGQLAHASLPATSEENIQPPESTYSRYRQRQSGKTGTKWSWH